MPESVGWQRTHVDENVSHISTRSAISFFPSRWVPTNISDDVSTIFFFQKGIFRYFFSIEQINKMCGLCEHMRRIAIAARKSIEQTCGNRQINTPEMNRTLTHKTEKYKNLKKRRKKKHILMMWTKSNEYNNMYRFLRARKQTTNVENRKNKKKIKCAEWDGCKKQTLSRNAICACDRFGWNVLFFSSHKWRTATAVATWWPANFVFRPKQ